MNLIIPYMRSHTLVKVAIAFICNPKNFYGTATIPPLYRLNQYQYLLKYLFNCAIGELGKLALFYSVSKRVFKIMEYPDTFVK